MNDFQQIVNVYAYKIVLSWLHIKVEQGNHLTIAMYIYIYIHIVLKNRSACRVMFIMV